MVDVNGVTPIDRVMPTPAAKPVGAVRPAASDAAATTGTGSAPANALARGLAASPPVDTDRVATIKKAIAEGRFPIVPAQIADRLIALKLQWNPANDAGDD